jgi:hypothetical protein
LGHAFEPSALCRAEKLGFGFRFSPLTLKLQSMLESFVKDLAETK